VPAATGESCTMDFIDDSVRTLGAAITSKSQSHSPIGRLRLWEFSRRTTSHMTGTKL
jgi:hypothetical protein